MDAKPYLVALTALVACAGCTLTQQRDPSIVYTGPESELPINGIAFDRAMIPEGSWTRVVVPEGTKVVRADESLRFQCAIRKEVANRSPGPDSASIHIARKQMGCAVCRDGSSVLRIGTFGDSAGEGNKTSLTLYLPSSLKVEFDDKQVGLKPKGVLTDGMSMNAVPTEWTALLDSPDAEEAAYRRAEVEAKSKKG